MLDRRSRATVGKTATLGHVADSRVRFAAARREHANQTVKKRKEWEDLVCFIAGLVSALSERAPGPAQLRGTRKSSLGRHALPSTISSRTLFAVVVSGAVLAYFLGRKHQAMAGQGTEKGKFTVFGEKEALGIAAAEYIASQERRAISEKGRFSVALSGGSLPKLIGVGLKALLEQGKIDPSKWHVYYADER